MSIFCPQAQYVLKTDDDIYVNLDLLHRSLLVEDKTLSENELTESESDKNNHVLFPQNSQQKQWKMYPVSRGSGIVLDEDRMDSGEDLDGMNVVFDYPAQEEFEKEG